MVRIGARPLWIGIWIASEVLFVGLSSCALFETSGIEHASRYAVTAPKHWKNKKKGEGDQAYELPSGSLVTLTSSCHRDSHLPLETLTKHLLLGARNVVVVQRKTIPVDGVDGLHSSVQATVGGVPFRLELLVFVKGDCIFDFTLLNRREPNSTDIEEFLAYIQSFSYGKN